MNRAAVYQRRGRILDLYLIKTVDRSYSIWLGLSMESSGITDIDTAFIRDSDVITIDVI